jgi:hypothetical protein
MGDISYPRATMVLFASNTTFSCSCKLYGCGIRNREYDYVPGGANNPSDPPSSVEFQET